MKKNEKNEKKMKISSGRLPKIGFFKIWEKRPPNCPQNRLQNGLKIGLENYHFGFHFGFHFGKKHHLNLRLNFHLDLHFHVGNGLHLHLGFAWHSKGCQFWCSKTFVQLFSQQISKSLVKTCCCSRYCYSFCSG